jgi:hypothetical protein
MVGAARRLVAIRKVEVLLADCEDNVAAVMRRDHKHQTIASAAMAHVDVEKMGAAWPPIHLHHQ